MKVYELIKELERFPAGRSVAICSGNESPFEGVYSLACVDDNSELADMSSNIYIVAGLSED